MNDDPFSDARIVASWRRNAAPWSDAVRAGRIESRRLATDRAVIDTVLGHSPRSVLDIGCGEGWLARALRARGVHVTGVDAVPELIERCRAGDAGDYRVASYADIAAGALDVTVDAVVCNFSLLGRESVAGLLGAVPRLLHPGGVLIVQTLHPQAAGVGPDPADGWRDGTWDGFGDGFADAPPWYFRTPESWRRLLSDRGLALQEQREVVHPRDDRPLSVIFIAGASDG